MQLKAIIRRTTGCKFYQLLPEKENAAIADNFYKGMWRWSGNTLCWQVTSIICQSLDGSHPRKCNEKELTLRWRRPQQEDLWTIKMTMGRGGWGWESSPWLRRWRDTLTMIGHEVHLLTSHNSNSQSWYRNLNLQSFC